MDPTQLGAARAAAAAFFRNRSAVAADGKLLDQINLQVHQGQYDYTQLKAWRDRARSSLFSMSEVGTLDIKKI
jgi:hypothetical protein